MTGEQKEGIALATGDDGGLMWWFHKDDMPKRCWDRPEGLGRGCCLDPPPAFEDRYAWGRDERYSSPLLRPGEAFVVTAKAFKADPRRYLDFEDGVAMKPEAQ